MQGRGTKLRGKFIERVTPVTPAGEFGTMLSNVILVHRKRLT